MKKQSSIILAALVATTLHAAAQGSLTPPPGVPGPVMKSLDQIEARTPLVAGQSGVTVDGVTGAITITARGSYYLTGNLTTTGVSSCIDVGNNTVSIDLNGFTISRTTGTETGSAGILINGAVGQKVMIKNGFFIGGGTSDGFAHAIRTSDGFNGSVHVENVHCFNVRGGIFLNYEESRNTARNCSVERSGSEGIRAEVVDACTVRDTIGTAIIGDVVSNCSVRQSSATYAGNGIVGNFSSFGIATVTHCYVYTQAGTAIRSANVNFCSAQSLTGSFAIQAVIVTSSYARRDGGVAISATTANGCVVPGGTVSVTNKYNMP